MWTEENDDVRGDSIETLVCVCRVMKDRLQIDGYDRDRLQTGEAVQLCESRLVDQVEDDAEKLDTLCIH